MANRLQPLSQQLLEKFPYSRHGSTNTLQRGRSYFLNGRVEQITLPDDYSAICQVRGDTGRYEVSLASDTQPGSLTFSCECPYGTDGNFCKHMYAAALAVADFLSEEAYDDEFDDFDDFEDDFDEGDSFDSRAWPRSYALPAWPGPKSHRAPRRKWQESLDLVLASSQSRANANRAARNVGLIILEPSLYYGFSFGYGQTSAKQPYTLTPFVFPAATWQPLRDEEPPRGPAEINDHLVRDTSWIRIGRVLNQQAKPESCLNLGPEAVALLNILVTLKSPSYYQAPSTLPTVLGLLARFDLPLFLGNTRDYTVKRRLRVQTEPIDLVVDLRRSDDGLVLAPGIESGEQFTPAETPATVVEGQPPWLVVGDRLAPLRTPAHLQLLDRLPLRVPPSQVQVFRKNYLVDLARQLPLRAGAVAWQEVQTTPIPRLYLRDDKAKRLSAELRFAYGEYEVPAAKNVPAVTVLPLPESWNLVRLYRQAALEAERFNELAGQTYGLKRGESPLPYGTFTLRARTHPFDFLLHLVPRLTEAGFEIYGEEQLKLGKVNRSTPTLRVSLTSGIDWFDLKTVVEFGDQQISLHAVRKALQKGERFIKLADGSAGQIPEAWLHQYRHLWKLATETDEGFRVSEAQLPLLDPLLEADPSISVPSDLLERRQRLRGFERIAAQPVAAGFRGKLRPYQQFGVEWLHFLREYHFGGILADDMGLGKTVQVLAFLQLLKEQATQPPAATLLVAPKSLIANWQREAERFTPGLRIFVSLGQGRSKGTKPFEAYDVVLTTYGTLLRDVDRLRRYKFHYVILDEAQAIKNPVSKSARAARLLNAEHRLSLTGTPVENNTLELWSQFAFLHPSLLGSLDFFRREFANPIESQGDEAAAVQLRRLIYPFILRRTKSQVAPELPPRAERLIYTDLAPAQAKLYARTRERYRAELLGLIETHGVEDARFKILEGLLRLRQIAIHPRLVEAGYRGEAPKLEILLETLETLRAEGHKALIFSQFVGMLKLVRRELDERKWKYVYLDGQTKDRQARVDLFQTDHNYPFFLISLKAGGVGLNLTAADYVIHLDPWWNPAVEMQASDRTHRIGQDKPVFIYKLIVRDTVEEKILQLQEKKRTLVNNLVTTEAGFFKSLTPDELTQLFD